ncbi:hypothetical protein AX15_001473 [Amanita polypyramis BW_CC]|nr:hypothetical protein AX15_001473 [Amanita polypyramis BW_CC]
MHQKAWSKKGGPLGTFPSDRIPPRPSSSKSGTASKEQQPNGGTTQGPSKPPKSQEVTRVEKLLKALSNSSGETVDPKGGCFCLARDHPLSTYVRICTSCGLILCSLNLPQYACPFCGAALFSTKERRSLIADLEQQIIDIQKHEAEERARLAEEAKKAAGAFPTLLESVKQPQPQHPQGSIQIANQGRRFNLPSPSQDTHKVLSLRTKPGSSKVVISSYTSSPAGSRPVSREPDGAEEAKKETRVPHPAREPKHASRTVDPSHPWENLLGRCATYVPRSKA